MSEPAEEAPAGEAPAEEASPEPAADAAPQEGAAEGDVQAEAEGEGEAEKAKEGGVQFKVEGEGEGEGEVAGEGEAGEGEAEGAGEDGEEKAAGEEEQPADGEVPGEDGQEEAAEETGAGEGEVEVPDVASDMEVPPVEDDDYEDYEKDKADGFECDSLKDLTAAAAAKDLKRKGLEKKKIRAMGSIISIRRGNLEYFDKQKVARYMNSYKLESDKPFNVDRVEAILKEVITEALVDLTYDADKVPKQAKWASSAIRAKIKEQEYDRYKIVCIVTIGEKRSQDVYCLFRMLWDCERDKYAKFTLENMYVFAIALCFGMYYE